VRREDQDKINKFSRLHQREIALEDELKAKHVSNTTGRIWVFRANAALTNFRLAERERGSRRCIK
jgi:hypothetical protein